MTEVVYGLDSAQRERVAGLRAAGRFFWIDVSLGDASRAEVIEALSVPARAVEALPATAGVYSSRTFSADGESVAFALRCYVASGPPAEKDAYRLRPVEAQVVVTPDYLLTLHDERLSLPAALAPDLPEGQSPRGVVYSVLDAVLASTFDALEEVELTLDTVAETGSDRIPRRKVREAAARLATMRRWVTAEQVAFERIPVELDAFRSFDTADEPYVQRVNGQVKTLLASVDAAANGLGMLLDLQLNERAYVVSLVATIFVPLTFITGFFGMNFGWMVDRIDSQTAFWLLGMAVPAAAALALWRFLMRRFFVTYDR